MKNNEIANFRWPFTPEEAEAMREQIADRLESYSKSVRSGEVDFKGGDKIVIAWERYATGVNWEESL